MLKRSKVRKYSKKKFVFSKKNFFFAGGSEHLAGSEIYEIWGVGTQRERGEDEQ